MISIQLIVKRNEEILIVKIKRILRVLASLSSQVELDWVETIIGISGYKNVMKSMSFICSTFVLCLVLIKVSDL